MPNVFMAIDETSLNVEPGAYWPCVARFTSGKWYAGLFRVLKSSWLMPPTQPLGGKAGLLAIARTEPSRTSSTRTAPAGAFKSENPFAATSGDLSWCVRAAWIPRVERHLGRVLQIGIDRERDVIADRTLLHDGTGADLFPGRIDLHVLDLGDAPQHRLVRGLDTVTPDERAGLISLALAVS